MGSRERRRRKERRRARSDSSSSSDDRRIIDKKRRHRRRSSDSSSSEQNGKDRFGRDEKRKDAKESSRKKDQDSRLMALAHNGPSKEDLGRWRKEYQENVGEHRDIGGSARRGRGGGYSRGNSSFMGHRREQRE